jgi:hypothetical protein
VFEIDSDIQGNEYRVLSAAMGGSYADNFLEFIEKRIKLFSLT